MRPKFLCPTEESRRCTSIYPEQSGISFLSAPFRMPGGCRRLKEGTTLMTLLSWKAGIFSTPTSIFSVIYTHRF